MERHTFIKTCGLGCLGILSGALWLEGCVGTYYLDLPITGSNIEVPLNEFKLIKNETIHYRKYLVVQNNQLEYPIYVYRHTENQYSAILMRCTHQGTELQAFGDRLQCPAHGSEFSSAGLVQNGPAENDLRSFRVSLQTSLLKIDLS